jgi:hypothetical protein
MMQKHLADAEVERLRLVEALERVTKERDEARARVQKLELLFAAEAVRSVTAEKERDEARASAERLRETVRKREQEHLAACADADEARAALRSVAERQREADLAAIAYRSCTCSHHIIATPLVTDSTEREVTT